MLQRNRWSRQFQAHRPCRITIGKTRANRCDTTTCDADQLAARLKIDYCSRKFTGIASCLGSLF